MVFEYVPTNPINQLEMWQAETFDPKQIDREGQTHRSCELIPTKQKHFAQSRREDQENKAVICFESLRLCASARVQLFFHSFIGVGIHGTGPTSKRRLRFGFTTCYTRMVSGTASERPRASANRQAKPP
jgi:hypothetical protein